MSILSRRRQLSLIAGSAGMLAAASAATPGTVPMTGEPPIHPWFDWIFFAIMLPWMALAAWDLARTRS